MKVKISLALFVCLFLVISANAQNFLKVNEAQTKVFSTRNGLQINLAIESDLSKERRAKVSLEILDKSDVQLARSDSMETVENGTTILQIPFRLPETESRILMWQRLRYSVALDGKLTSGIVSLSEIMPELFNLQAESSKQISAGTIYEVRVRALHPIKNAPVADVEIDAELKIEIETESDEDELIIKAQGKTDDSGYAVLQFQIPPDVKFESGESVDISLIGTKGGLKISTSEDLDRNENQPFVYFLTDKPLYQPGQKIYVRGLAMRKNEAEAGMTIAAEKDFEFSIKDEENKTLFRQKVKTSRFGIAAIEWQIPANSKLGEYKIEATDEEAEQRGIAIFKVSRYDLPNFVVQTKSDKDFYLPEQNTAEITVDALYLFGKPVTKGKVKIVKESQRSWDYYKQKWDIREETTYEGETDAEGKYLAKIDLTEAQENLRNNADQQFQDLNFAAYFTDDSTNKTEQRRFDIRVSREPIHIYLTKTRGGENNPKIPLQFYLSTFAADGKAEVCDVEIKGKYEDETEEKTLGTIKTNSLGAGKFEFFAPERADGVYNKNFEIKTVARDAEKRTGKNDFGYRIDNNEKQIFVRTNKAIYRQGEPLKIKIISTEQDETVFVDVFSSQRSVESRRVKLKNGRAELRLPFKPEFKNYLVVSAFFADNETVQDSNGVVFPQKQNLQISAETNKETFRPAEEAQMNFTVSSSDKKQTEAALGVVILDKAVEERARTDANFGGVNIFQNFGGLTGGWNEIDPKKITDELQLSAEIQFANTNFERNTYSSGYAENLQNVFGEQVRNQLIGVQAALWNQHNKNYEHATNDESFRKILNANGVNFDNLRDPWGNNYRARFTPNRWADTIEIISAGANKTFGDADDFTAWNANFQYVFKEGAKINEAVQAYTQKTGKSVRDIETLRAALMEKDINFDNLKDRWGEPYRIEFGVYYRNFTISFKSGGEDKKFTDYYYDTYPILTVYTDYFLIIDTKISEILSKFIADKKTFPNSEAEFKQILRDGGFDFDALRDAWDRPFYVKFEAQTQNFDKVSFEKTSKEMLKITPVTREIGKIEIRSSGASADKKDESDDLWLGSYAGMISEKSSAEKLIAPRELFASGKSAIYGIVTDANNAVVPNAKVIITNTQTLAAVETITGENGNYLKTNLAPGKYSVKVESSGFKVSMLNDFALASEKIGEINFTLEVGGAESVVNITADTNTTIDLSDTKIDTSINREVLENLPSGTSFSSLLKIAPNVRPEPLSGGFQIDGASGGENSFLIDGQELVRFRSGIVGYEAEYGGATGGAIRVVTKSSEIGKENNVPTSERKSTPRLREYFPETLLWIPELVTDQNGKVSITFRLADNITTWKIYAIASDTQGRVGVTSKEIKAFQPFFVDLDPPKFLTEGDEIYLPSQVRNYTPTKQNVNVEMAQSDWFSFLGAGTQTVAVEPNASQNAIFGFKAISPITDGKQRVTAIADTDSDAIEKPVTVRPNGQEIVNTQSKLFTNSATFDVNYPSNALPKTNKAELKIYPNLLAHVTESVEGLLRRPYGCGEQTTSSTYPNLMILKFAKGGENQPRSIPKSLEIKAKKFLQMGYERLLGYQVADGGFSYWGGKDSSNAALTAYILRFLSEAKEFIEVDENVFRRAQNYLVAQQNSDGSFTTRHSWENSGGNSSQTKLSTAYIARILAADKDANKAVLQKALNYLKANQTDAEEPYTLALFGLASLDAGNVQDAQNAAEKLRAMAKTEDGATFWNLETSTPFYGWGMTGKLETTAVVLQFLLQSKVKSQKSQDQTAKAVFYLLKNKDRYGVWYSTQTTINVLKAFLATLSEGQNQTVSISLNGEKLKDLTIAADQIEPIILDLSDKLSSANRLDITSSNASTLMAQIVSTHYIDWAEADLSSKFFRLKYECDKQSAAIMDEINCSVEAERLGTQYWGMILAEIGTPPGADVSRESLEKAFNGSDWSLSKYEVLPDRIVVYLWSKPGGTKFNFKFRPRYGINANTPASVVYDYYNPEAQATIAPLKFEVK